MLMRHGTRNLIAERIRRLLGRSPCPLQVAALPWRTSKGEVEILMVTSRDSGRWVLPKGWPEDGEQLHEAAAREAKEEAGVDGDISNVDFGRFYYGKHLATGLERRCEVLVFPLEVATLADRWPEKSKRTRKWFAPAKAAMLVREPDLGELLDAFSGFPRKFAA